MMIRSQARFYRLFIVRFGRPLLMQALTILSSSLLTFPRFCVILSASVHAYYLVFRIFSLFTRQVLRFIGHLNVTACIFSSKGRLASAH